MTALHDNILAFLEVADEENAEIDTVKFQKIFFLLENEEHVFMGLEFEPYIFGPYSRKLENIVKELVNDGKVKVSIQDVGALEFGIVFGQRKIYYMGNESALPANVDNKVICFFRKWVRKSIWDILGYIYMKYPEYFLSVKKFVDQ